MGMKFGLFDHAGKGVYLRQKLLEAGHQQVTQDNPGNLDLLVLDCDWPWAHPRPELIEAFSQKGTKVVLYPHGGRPTVWVYDGICEPDKRVHARLEHGPGSIQIGGMIGGDLRQEATGWLFSPTQDFQPVEKPKKILFAPLHPNIEMFQKGTNGHDPAPSLNQSIYKRLLALPDVEITVTVAGPLWRHGVWHHPKTKLVYNPHMGFQHSFEEILKADAVVAAGTMAAAAVALGKPTVMFCQDTFMDYVDGRYVQAENQDRYKDLVRYPLDAEDGALADLLETACESEQKSWRDLWVGNDGTQKAVVLLESLVIRPESPAKSDVMIQGATARATSN